MKKSNFWKSYGFLILMLTGIVAGCVVGAIWPAVMEVVDGETIIVDKGATVLEPLGTVFLNLMFCIAVPTVFCSISSSIANMQSARRAGKIMGVTIATFLVTAAFAAVIMYVTVRLIPPVVGEYALVEGEVGGTLGVADMIVNFFTKPDFTELFSRRAILPLIVAAILFGFGIQMAGGAETKTAKLLEDVTNCIMKTFKIITYYAPIGFFGFFAYLIAYHGSDLIGDYGRALAIYYILSFVYMLVFSPIYARFGGGRGAAKVMFSKLFRPAAMSFGTCSSVATIPTNMEVAEETGISKDVSNIVIPLGATMHMDGSAMSAIIKVAFLFGMFGQDFTTGRAILAIIVAVFSSVAMSGIPGAAARANSFCARSSSRIIWPSPSPSRWRSAIWSIPPRRWSTLPAIMLSPSSSPAMLTAKTGCRSGWPERRKRMLPSFDNDPHFPPVCPIFGHTGVCVC